MSRFLIALTLASTLVLSACGGGSGTNSLIPIDGWPPIGTTPDDDDADAPLDSNVLADLYGDVVFVYGFMGLQDRFRADVTYSADDLIESDGSVYLMDSANTSYMINGDQTFTRGRDMGIICTFVDISNQFLCGLDTNGANESFFLFNRPTNGTISGNFEYCDEVAIGDCAGETLSAPDGFVNLQIFEPLRAARKSLESGGEALDLRPYLQYNDQGSASLTAGGFPDAANEHVDALVKAMQGFRKVNAE